MCVQNSPLEGSPSRKGCLRRPVRCLLVIMAVLLFHYVLYFLLRGPLPADLQLIAHRGGPAHNPENTMVAFRYAIEIGADWLEMDVHRTLDGALVIIHDETVDRTTNGTGNVSDLTLEQLRALDAGGGEQVPTFEEVILLAQEAEIGLMPEVKSPSLYPGIETEMVAAVAEAGYLRRTVLQSFEVDAVENMCRANTEAMVSPLYWLWWQVDPSAPPGDARILCPMAEMVVLNPWLIREAHREGREVYVWFGILENPIMMRVMLALGVDGLIVDDPVALTDILDRHTSG
jgi:glycerophosphoryl diester phosphodiesterase